MNKSGACPSCGEAASGKFCANCGASLGGVMCAQCSQPLAAGTKFCPNCGARSGATAGESAPAGTKALAWLVPGIAVALLVAFLIGQRLGRSPAAAEGGAPLGADAGTAPFAAGGRGAPDISNMSPEERARRLYDRVMAYGERGQQDSARMFAPMALQAYGMLDAIGAHEHYDMGMIALVSGDAALARAEADTILKTAPSHLLGLILGMKAAALRNDVAARTALQKRFAAALQPERAKNLQEYANHASDIDAAAGTAPGAKAKP
jgi:hypothetical protein